MEEFSISAIDLVVVNLYPFEKSVNDGDDYTRVIENIDIGGPTLIRAAAKNYKYVSVLVEKADYEPFLKSIEENNGCSTFTQRENLAKAAFTRTAE